LARSSSASVSSPLQPKSECVVRHKSGRRQQHKPRTDPNSIQRLTARPSGSTRRLVHVTISSHTCCGRITRSPPQRQAAALGIVPRGASSRVRFGTV
jgi:hypothetical protein